MPIALTIFHQRVWSLFVITGALLFSTHGYADTIFLRNGNTIEGIIAQEDETDVKVRIGAGTISLGREEIERIERSDVRDTSRIKKEWGTDYFLNDDYVPANLKSIADDYRQLETARNAALENKQQRDELIKTLDQYKVEIKELQLQLSALGKRLSQAQKNSDMQTYNDIIKNYNAAMGSLTTKRIEYDDLSGQLPDLNKSLNSYMDRVRAFKQEIERIAYDQESSRTDEESTFLAAVLDHLSVLVDELQQHVISYEGDAARMVVQTLLNERVTAHLIIDTGASLVLISPRIAESLDIDYRNAPSIQATLADGRKVPAYSIMLESVKIGDTVVTNVPASVIDEKTATEDGLLGMSFLQNFMIRLDPQNNQLILEEFNP